ncbi:NADPH-dependent FMN reductase [Aestuariivirga sp. YIM B02566]|uniref:NAD(P)H-dependent oxidoreductase n=1 Tax=Taklimakanibacter albus TaxID=2800327 RepID=A0ACC5REX7_9HYPH|nr:NADPH-dependent FMN reductase [Aestuariivirga sp. YIM B02566]MBK1871256.1 NAD(P)H-dependent oxidoreductase [Aestuariivirga sp. YIM B02566]
MKLIALSGSLRHGSFNTKLAHEAARLAPEDVHVTVETIHGIPLYDADAEVQEGLPERVTALKNAIMAADGLLLVTPEYNNSIPGVFKNAIDWLSRPDADIKRVFGGRPVALTGASPGGFGTILSQNAWLPVFRTLKVNFWSGGRLLVSRAQGAFGESGTLANPATEEQLKTFMAGFAAFIRMAQPEP